MKQKKRYICILLLISQFSYAQKTLSKLLHKYNTERIPYISVEALNTKKEDLIILDARELIEYNVSHIKNAIHVGYNNFNLSKTAKKLKNKGQYIVVYCSLGIRSEDIAEQLKNIGYTNIYNLYGGIFEWKNKNFNVYNSEDKDTENIHVYSKAWGKWLTKGIKVYD